MEVEDLPEFMGRNQQKEMKLRESKSQGNLMTTRQVPPVVSQIHCLQPTSRQNKESVQLIKKIRDELGMGMGMGLGMGSSE